MKNKIIALLCFTVALFCLSLNLGCYGAESLTESDVLLESGTDNGQFELYAEEEKSLYKSVIDEKDGSNEQAKAIVDYFERLETFPENYVKSEGRTEYANAVKEIVKTNFPLGITLPLDGTPTAIGASCDGEYSINDGQIHSDYKSNGYCKVFAYTFDGEEKLGSLSLEPLNYGKYDEVYFGLYVLVSNVSDEPFEKGECVITVCGKSFYVLSSSGHHYYKVEIIGDRFTVYDDNASGNGETLLQTQLSQDVTDGSLPLVIGISFTSWARVEITDTYFTLSYNS